MKCKTIFVAVMVGLLIIGNNFVFAQTSQGSKPIATEKEAEKAKPKAPQDITNVPSGTGKSSCSARSENGKISCSKSCKDGKTAACSSTETKAICVCE